jgi:hypothetical protein
MSRAQLIVLWIFGIIIALLALFTTSYFGTFAFLIILGALFFISFSKKQNES